jgi:ZU5 domain
MSRQGTPNQTPTRERVEHGVQRPMVRVNMLMAALWLASGCAGDSSNSADVKGDAASLRAMIGPEGGDLVGQAGTPFAGVSLHFPAGALQDATEIEVHALNDAMPLPATAVACGPMFEISPVGLALAKPATLTMPFSETAVSENDRFDDEVKVWWLGETAWGQREQVDSHEGSVSVEISALRAGGAGVNPPAETDTVHLVFHPDPKILPCLAQYADDDSRQPSVEADVVRGDLNDGLFLRGKWIKPGLAFDMFTVERSSLQADATKDPNFHGFGFAWYQSDLEANDNGSLRANIRTILLDQIFGFDPDVQLQPTNTFQVGFWFNDPNDAAACGFDVTKPTPFNGEHKAGPLAMITVPDAKSGLGPLCTKPDTSVTPARCDP